MQISIKVPSFKESVTLQEFPYPVYKTLVKTIINGNDQDINDSFEQLISKYSVCDHSKLNIFDKFVILCHLYSFCISPDIKFKITCEETNKDYTHVVPIQNLIQVFNEPTPLDIVNRFRFNDVANMANETNSNKSINSLEAQFLKLGDLDVKFHIPKKLYHNSNDDLVIWNTEYLGRFGVPAFHPGEMAQIKSRISYTTQLAYTRKFAVDIVKKYNKIPLLRYSSPFFKDAKVKEIFVSVLDNQLFDLLKVIFGRELQSLYHQEYYWMKNNIDYTCILNSTYNDMMVYDAVIAKEEKETNDE